VLIMKNGPIFSNISMINKAFSHIGSPLHYKLIVDYMRVNWAHGRGLSEMDAKNFLDLAINAGYYYELTSDQHYQRKHQLIKDLDPLYIDLTMTKIPHKLNTRRSNYRLTDINRDERFSVITTENSENYILLNQWNLLNDLAIRLFIKKQLKNISIPEVTRLIKFTYRINDPHALFLPNIDYRFKMTAGGKVSLKDYDESVLQEFHVEVTPFIHEEVAKHTSQIINYLKEYSGETVKIREIIRVKFGIEVHLPKFSAYFESVKLQLPKNNNIYISTDGDSLFYLLKEEASIVVKQTLVGKTETDREYIDSIVRMSGNNTSLTTQNEGKVALKNKLEKRTKLSYTLTYYDRIQETLAGHYFEDWINEEDQLRFILKEGNLSLEYMIFYDHNKRVLFGNHLENLMGDYALIPGQKLYFNVNETGILELEIGPVDQYAIKEQERYADIAKLAEENQLSSKSISQLVAELLIYHPSGLHVSEIIRLVNQNGLFAESSIYGALSKYDFFERIPEQNGYWQFNPAKWKSSKIKTSKDKTIKSNNKEIKPGQNKLKNPKPLEINSRDYFNSLAKHSKKNRRRMTNEMYILMDKKDFIEEAWFTYIGGIYDYANKFESPALSIEDFCQEAYIALNKAYDNYDPSYKGSFYNYFKRYLTTTFQRYEEKYKNLIRLPTHRSEYIRGIEKKYLNNLFDGIRSEVPTDVLEDYTIMHMGYISYEEVYLHHNWDLIENPIIRGRVTSYFSNPFEYEICNASSNNNTEFLCTFEPDTITFEDWYYEEKYNLIEDDFISHLWNHLDENSRSSIPPSEVLRLRKFDSKEHTLEEVGKLMGVTRERIRQIEQKAMSKARDYCRKRGYTPQNFV
jgi:RNA polymerase primary sigma factor